MAHAAEAVEQTPLLLGVQTCTSHLEINIVVSQKIGSPSTSRPNYIIPEHIRKGHPTLSRHLLNYVHNSFIHNSQKLKTT